MTPVWVDARFSKWDAILARPEPSAALAETHLMWRYSRTLAFAARRDATKTAAEFAGFEKEESAIPENAPFGLQTSCKSVHAVAREVLEARIAEAQSKPEDAIRHWLAAVDAQDKLFYDEPADWYYPVRESLGGFLLRSGNYAEAERVFRADLERNRNSGRSLFGLIESLKAQKKSVDALQREFQNAWKNADTKLSVGSL